MSDAIHLNALRSITRARRLGAALCVWGLLAPIAPARADDPVQAMLQAAEEATLSSRLAGQIKLIGVKAGDRFAAGQKLVQFDCAIGEQEARKARAELDIAKATLASNLKLKELNSISDLEVAVARAQQDKAQAEVDRAAAQLQYCTLAAPYAGRVVARHCNPLENVTIGQPLLDIVALGTPTIQMFVPSAWLAWLKPGLEFDVEVRETSTRHKARIERVGARVDAVSQTVELFAAFVDDNPNLLPGMSGSAFISAPATP